MVENRESKTDSSPDCSYVVKYCKIVMNSDINKNSTKRVSSLEKEGREVFRGGDDRK